MTSAVTTDTWGAPVAADDPGSVMAWNDAWAQAMHFMGDPFDRLASANENDERFALGSVFTGTYRILGGAAATSDAVQADIARVQERARSPREKAHADALDLLARGDFTASARRWDGIAAQGADFAAVRFAHDVHLHVGDAPRRLRSSEQAARLWDRSMAGWGLIAGQYAFALEEVGLYDEAVDWATQALDDDPMDLWALHAISHVHEARGDHAIGAAMLRERQSMWSQQHDLAVHIWWHLTLHLLALGQFDEVLAIHDQLVADAQTPFRLCDLTSMLWRLDLRGVDVGSRWNHITDTFAARPERHTNGFLDLHMALAFSRVPDHWAAADFFGGVADAHENGEAENDRIFGLVVAPLVDAIRQGRVAPQRSAAIIDELEPHLRLVGGSIAQRDVISLTRTHYQSLTAEAS